MLSKVLFSRPLVFSLVALSLASLLKSSAERQEKKNGFAERSARGASRRHKTSVADDDPIRCSRILPFAVHSRTKRYSCIPFRSM